VPYQMNAAIRYRFTMITKHRCPKQGRDPIRIAYACPLAQANVIAIAKGHGLGDMLRANIGDRYITP